MSASFIILYSFTIFIASIIPGPSMILALTHGIQYGTKKTIASAMGNVLVTLIQALISVAGLGTILMASSSVFIIVKYLGSAYLIFLGIKTFFNKNNQLEVDNVASKIENNSTRKMFLQSIFVTASNPKAILFFAAIFPQFITTETTFILQSFVLLGLACLIAFICFMIYALGGQRVFSLISKSKIGKYLDKILGITFIGAGVGLATAS